MGKGDKKTKRGKIFKNSWGKSGRRKPKFLKILPSNLPIYVMPVNSIHSNSISNCMSILIDKVRIKNFRSLRNVEVNLQPITLLVGANNAGKTTFLRALNTVFGVSKSQITRDDLFIDKDSQQPEKSIIIDVRIVPVDDKGKRLLVFEDSWAQVFGADAKPDDIGDLFAFRTEIKFINEGDKYESNQYVLTDWQMPDPTKKDRLTSTVSKAVLLYFIYAHLILNRANESGRFPQKIKELLDKISAQLGVPKQA